MGAFCCYDKCYEQKWLREKRVYLTSRSQCIYHQGKAIQEFRAKTEGRGGCKVYAIMLLTGMPFMACSAFFFEQPRASCLGVYFPQWDMISHLTSSINKTSKQTNKNKTEQTNKKPKRLDRLVFRPIWWRYFLKWSFFFFYHPDLCQFDKKLIGRTDSLSVWHVAIKP